MNFPFERNRDSKKRNFSLAGVPMGVAAVFLFCAQPVAAKLSATAAACLSAQEVEREKVRTACTAAIAEAGTDAESLNIKAQAYTKRGSSYLGRDNVAAVKDYNEAIRLQPNYAPAYYWRGFIHGQLDEDAKMIADYEKAREMGYRRPMLFFSLGTHSYHSGDIDKSLVYFTEMTSLGDNEEKSSAYGWRAFLHYQKGDYDSAIADATQSIRLHGSAPMAYYVRGKARQKQGDAREGAIDIEKARSQSSRIETFLTDSLGIRP